MKTPQFFRKQRMMTQLCVTFGLIVLFLFGMFIALWAISVFSLRDSIISESRSNLRDQVAEVGRRISEEAKEVFETKISVGTRSFLAPISIVLFDTSLQSGYSLQPLPRYTGEKLTSLKQPLTNFEERFQCSKATCVPSPDAGPELSTTHSSGGCDCRMGLKRISLEASSVFQTGMDGSAVRESLGDEADNLINRSSYIDGLLRDVWESNKEWIQVYIGLPARGGSLFRSYPGSVREGLGDAGLSPPRGRYYDPVIRPWYTLAVENSRAPGSNRDKRTQIEAPRVIVSEPYEDADGKGVLISVSSAIYGGAGELIGVGGLDLFVQSLRSFIVNIKARENGEAFLFHRQSDLVLASRQLTDSFRWTQGTGTEDTLPALATMALVSGLEGSRHFSDLSDSDYPCRKSTAGDSIKHGVMLLWTPVFDAQFCLVVATPIGEIDSPIEDQLDDIKAGAAELFRVPLLLCLICGGVLIVIVLLIAVELSRPLKQSAFESQRIAESIGHPEIDLRAPDQRPGILQLCYQAVLGNVGEVTNLRSRFHVLLDDLLAKRQTVKPAQNPLHGHTDAFQQAQGWTGDDLDEAQAEQLTGLTMVGGVSIETRVEVKAQFEDRKTFWNRLRMQLSFKVIFPLVVCIVGIVVYSSLRMNAKATDWAKPVQEQMIIEELQSLEQRVDQRARFVTEYLTRERNTLIGVKQYWRSLIQGDFNFEPGSAPTAFLEPRSQCARYLREFAGLAEDPVFVSNGACTHPALSPETLAQDANDNFRPAQADINVEGASLFVPRDKLVDDPANDGRPPTKTPAESEAYDLGTVAEEARVMAHMSNAMRAGYFSTVPTDIYLGTHMNEAMWIFPTNDLEGYMNPNGPRYCDSVRDAEWSVYKGKRTETYNPTCRPWYQRAVLADDQEAIIHNPIDYAAGYNEPVPYLALSTPLWINNQLVGVLALDIRLGQLYSALQNTPLYEKGYAFIWDENGLAVVHKGIKPGLTDMSIRWVDATSGGDYELDEDWFREQEKGIFSHKRTTGNWTYTWYNNVKKQDEIWHYFFTPIDNTPYMLALSTFQPDVTKKADDMLVSLKKKVETAAGITAGLVALGCLFLGALVYWFNKNMARPIDELADYMGVIQSTSYQADLPLSESAANSFEMSEITANMHKMLVALRFCNKDYTKGDIRKEMDSCCDALELTVKTGNKGGEGICYNNMGLAASVMAAQQPRPNYSRTVKGSADADSILVTANEADTWFQKAVKSAQELPDSDGKSDLVATRKFNHALYKVAEGDEREGGIFLREAFGLTDSPAAIARMAFGGLRPYVDKEAEPWLYTTLADGAERALLLMAARHDNAPASIAEACAVIAFRDFKEGNMHAASTRAWWALTTLTHMSTPCLKVLLFSALTGSSDAVIHQAEANLEAWQIQGFKLDHVVRAARQKQQGQAGQARPPSSEAAFILQETLPPKTVLFTIDISGSMQTMVPTNAGNGPNRLGVRPSQMNRLEVCKESLLQAVDNVILPGDELGFYVFDNNFDPVWPLQVSDSETPMQLEGLVKKVAARGGTAFWDALRKSMELCEAKAANADRWIIALTDGEDHHSQTSSFPWLLENIKKIRVNLVVITVATDAAAGYVRMLQEEAVKAGNKVMHIGAKNEEIAEAFGKVASLEAETPTPTPYHESRTPNA